MNHRVAYLSILAVLTMVSLGLPQESSDAIRQGPRVLAAGALNLGKRIPEFTLEDIAGQAVHSNQLGDAQAVVVALTSTGCPLCKKYAPTLAAIEREYSEQAVAFLFINPHASEKTDDLQADIRTQGFQGHYIRDEEQAICRQLEARTTTEVFVLDRARTLVYRGAVDDQYGFGYALDAPRQHYLKDALEAVLNDAPVAIPATTAPGCELFYPPLEAASTPTPITYHNRISRIIQRNCLECHRDSSVAPMPLTNYDEVKDYAGMIRSVVERGIMPPWFAANNFVEHKQTEAAQTSGSQSGELHTPLWANDRSLSAAEQADLLAWVAAGAPEGEPTDAPLPRNFPTGWLIGQPDAELTFPEPVPIKATGILPYQNIIVETNLPEDRWVQAIEIVPGDRNVVHHVLVFVLPPGENTRTGGVDYWGIYVPGNSTQVYPEGYARRLPKNARLKFQMHYTTNGRATEDQTKIGLVFAKQPPQYEVKTASIVNTRFQIPPRTPDFQVVASLKSVPSDVDVLGFLPHHHLRGKACRYELTTPAGDKETLLDVPRYDFNWQLFYRYREPRRIPQGSRIDFIGWYDNSQDNPANPDPNVTVGWGEQTYDEMHLGYLEFVVPLDPSTAEASETGLGWRREGLLERLDANGDGTITKSEVRGRMPGQATSALRVFDQLDRNRDGKLDRSEAASLRDRR